MAIAFARVSIHTRSKGHSAVAAASYRSGTRLFDSRTGITHDFSNRQDVVWSALLLPEGTNEAFQNREFLWNQAEASEKRKDAQLCKDIVLALPKELDLNHQIELTQEFVQTHFIKKGLPADISIHDEGNGNPHAHILISTRRLENEGFSRYKARDLNPTFARGKIVENDYWGEQWREAQNAFFEEKNLDRMVDPNHVIGEHHQGKIRSNNSYLQEANRIIKEAREEFILDSVDKTVEHLAQKFSVFSRRDVERLLFKSFQITPETMDYLQRVKEVLSDKNIVHLGENDKGKDCYTTRQQYLQEAKLRQNIEEMMYSSNHVFTNTTELLSKQYHLSEEQQKALAWITQSPDISVVIGRPGTGKSYLLKPVKDYFEANHCEVIGVSLSGKVAKSLQKDTGIASSTIASLTYRLTHNQLQLTSKHIIVLDEAGMVDCNNISFLIQEAKKAGSKIILTGDPDQLKPIHKGEIFRGIAAITGYMELENIKRQNDLGDRQASIHLSKGRMKEALNHYQGKNAIVLSDTPYDAIDNIITDWKKNITADNLKDSILLSFTRKAVAELNQQARIALKEKNILGEEDREFQGADRILTIATGERLLFRQNDKILGVRNGDSGTVHSMNKEGLSVKLDSGELLLIPRIYKALDYAYALTVHKSQGMTAEHTHVLIDSKYWDRNLSFVAMTRHKQNLKIHADRINHPDLKALHATLSRSVTRDNVIDWPLNYGIRAGFHPDKLIGKVMHHIAGIGHKIVHCFNYVVNYEEGMKKETMRQSMEAARHLDSDYQKRHYEALKIQNPLFNQYDTLLKQASRTSGYYREKMDKNLQEIAGKLVKNEKFIQEIKKVMPEHFYQFLSRTNKNLQKTLERDC